MRTVVANGSTAIVDGNEVIHFCSNDYLGLSQNKEVIRKTIDALQEISQCSSRLIAGNHPKILQLEQMLADHRTTESALVYPTGYVANLGTLTAVADKGSTIFSDELNHASIIDACRLSSATIRIFRHNDIAHLKELIKQVHGRKIIVTEGIFSIDGDASQLQEIGLVAKQHDAITIVDDAHGDFIDGTSFSGIPSKFGVDIDIHVSSMSKALGCFGGYVATTKSIRDLLINASREFIYTSALPAHLCCAAIAAIPLAKKGNLQEKLENNIDHFSTGMKRIGFEIGSSRSHIIPVRVGQEKTAVEFSRELLNAGIFVQAIRYPTVKKGSSRLRVSLTALHTKEDIDFALDAFEKVGKKIDII